MMPRAQWRVMVIMMLAIEDYSGSGPVEGNPYAQRNAGEDAMSTAMVTIYTCCLSQT